MLISGYGIQHLLDLLEPVNCPAIQSATITTLVCVLIEAPQNTRTFEELDGLLTITSLFKSRETSREVKLKLVEFLSFYLMPETPSIASASAAASIPAMLQRSPLNWPAHSIERKLATDRRRTVRAKTQG